MALHRLRQTDAEWLRRKLQRQLPRRVLERDAVLVARSGPRRHQCMEGGLQQEQTPLIAGQYHPPASSQSKWLWKNRPHKARLKTQDSPENWRESGSQVIRLASIQMGIKFMDPYTSLRQLLDEVFETDRILDYPTLVSRYSKSIGGSWDIVFGIKERKWFPDDSDEKELIFQYLSFEIKDGKLDFFRLSREALKKRREAVRSDGYIEHTTQNCFFHVRPTPDLDVQKLFNLTKRLFVFHYKNCGPKKHFLKSISERFVKEFWRNSEGRTDSPYDYENVAKYIRDRIGINCLFFKQRDEMFFDRDFQLDDVILPMIAGATSTGDFGDLLQRLNKDKQFGYNLTVAVQKKNIAFGNNGRTNYVISTVTTPSFDIGEDGAVGNYKSDPQIITIYVSEKQDVSLDQVIIADDVISNFVRLNESYQTQFAQEQIEQYCSDAEAKLSINPVLYRTDLLRELRSLIHKIFMEFQTCGFVGDMSLSLFNPFGRCLRPVYSSASDEMPEDVTLPLKKQSSFAAVQSFTSGKPFQVWHPHKVESEEAKRERFNWTKKPSVEFQREIVGSFTSITGEVDLAISCIPVTVNHVTVGVVEFTADDRGSFASDREIIRRIASLSGDVLRRLELANDRGWLTRMQFLYAARHKLERVIQQISSVAPALATELETILGAAKVDQTESAHEQVSFEDAMRLLGREVAQKFSVDVASAIMKKFRALSSVAYLSRGTLNAVREVLEALHSNEKHSHVDANYLSIFAGSYGTSETPVLMISYKPDDKWERCDIIDQLCVSPISDNSDFTYHYGLFLLGTHVRMAGGVAQGTPAIPDEIDHSEFGISIILPGITEKK